METKYFYTVYGLNKAELESDWDGVTETSPAPLATELLELLKPSNTNHEIFYKAQDKQWYIFVPKNSVANESCGVQVASGENFAECLAQLIIQLNEKGVICLKNNGE